ncbi:uncharacterized protein MJAP1_002019 [Malassezia japonica]|uniref:Uncharacterized protein n=1 Tax=Malassezia japonica TaxID=223818 RepID=A0AAF0F2W2_9BASI|nr:uncharacterized protein MJAP1_002019 [Malassezia japonica]WFD39049.1 hypothetical protein MJAP1_002019 [Malassezia japonica]
MSSPQNFREPFTIDVVIRALDKVPFSPPFLVILPVLALFLDRRGESVQDVISNLPTFAAWKELLFDRYKWFGRAMIFIALKMLSRCLSRRAANNGVPKADPPNWKKDVLVITGGSAGIGKDIVELLSRRYQARIAVLDIATPTYVAATNGAPPILWIKTDVTKREAIAAANKKIIETFGEPPSFVVSCAGIAIGGPVLSVSPESVLKTMQINAIANIHMAQEFVPHMVQQNHGHYVTVASSASYYTPPMLSSYCMSKAAALAFHEELRTELRVLYKAPRVRTSIVTPTKVRTLLGHALKDTDNAFISPTLEPVQVAEAVVGAVNSGLSQAISQPLMTKLLPFVRAMPDWYRKLIEIVGKTDSAVTADSIREGLRAGYGKNWSEDDFKSILGEMDSNYNKSQ